MICNQSLHSKVKDDEKVNFYDQNKEVIHPKIKTWEITKPLWRKLFWTAGRNSNKYKIGCVNIFKTHFPFLYRKLVDTHADFY